MITQHYLPPNGSRQATPPPPPPKISVIMVVHLCREGREQRSGGCGAGGGGNWREMEGNEGDRKVFLMWVRQGGEAYVGEAGRRGLIMWVR